MLIRLPIPGDIKRGLARSTYRGWIDGREISLGGAASGGIACLDVEPRESLQLAVGLGISPGETGTFAPGASGELRLVLVQKSFYWFMFRWNARISLWPVTLVLLALRRDHRWLQPTLFRLEVDPTTA